MYVLDKHHFEHFHIFSFKTLVNNSGSHILTPTPFFSVFCFETGVYLFINVLTQVFVSFIIFCVLMCTQNLSRWNTSDNLSTDKLCDVSAKDADTL